MYQGNAHLPAEISNYKRGGLVVFPGKAPIGMTFTIMIPLRISGEVKVDGHALDMDHYYHIPKECSIEVSTGAKLVVLVISDFA